MMIGRHIKIMVVINNEQQSSLISIIPILDINTESNLIFIKQYCVVMDEKTQKILTKKNYDDISLQKRLHLIQLIDRQKWTIRDAATQLGIKHCTAKHILYSYRKNGKVFEKKKKTECCHHQIQDPEPTIQYVYVPYPVFIYPSNEADNASIKLERKAEF